MARRKRRRTHKRRGTHRKARVHRRKRRSVAAAPRRRSHRRRGVRRSRGRRYVAARGPGNRRKARTYRVRNRHGKPLFHVRGWRARRSNPGMSGVVAAAVGLAAGLAATLVASYAIDVFMSTQSTTVQTGVLVVLAGAAGFLIGNPAVAAGIATGLLVVPLSKAVYTAMPSLANPSPMASSATTPVVTTSAAPAMSALHRQYRALHIGKPNAHHNLRALHIGNAQRLGGPIRGFVPGQATAATRFR